MINLRKLCSVGFMQCCFVMNDAQEVDVLEREQGKTPSVHDCTQISIVNIKSTGSPSTVEILKLSLIVIDSIEMLVGTQYEIYPYGLKSSQRNLKDGCVYAGSAEKSNGVRINDIVLPEKEKGIGKRHFMIQYVKGKRDIDIGGYMIKDMGEGMGTFIRLDKPLKLQNNFIVSFGDSHVIVQLEGSTLHLRFIDGPRNEEKL
jgi:hypothetical protein